MREINPPQNFKNESIIGDIFLAGSIEMGVAENWQKRFIEEFSETELRFLNPRRLDWDSSWKQEIDNPQFNEQVNWELDGLDFADLIVFYFVPNTKSPITLMELGLHAQSGKCIVCCPEGFWRKGNVDIVCEKYKIKSVKSFEELVTEVKNITKFWKV